jgi:superfamily II DNA or RNA helicase
MTRDQLWPHQIGASEMVEHFLGVRAGEEGSSALVRMPTGTGKSGVIAVAAQELVPSGDVLLLTPWDVLVRQLAEDVESDFWQQIGTPVPYGKGVVRIYPSTVAEQLSSHRGQTIWMATIATLQTLHASGADAYEELHRRLRLVVVDEGHYEPARSWSEAVRGLKRPTVLFSATPYRNDVKYFDLAEEFQFHFSHTDAEDRRILRGVAFEPISFDSVPEFCDRVIAAVDERFGSNPKTKIIIRCDSRAEIGQMIDALVHRGQSVLGVHERFPGNDGVRLQRVPDPDARPERYWVHQYKLTEGIDSPDFKAVAFFRPLPSERAFVQQVGRVLRNPTRSETDVGLVIHRDTDALATSWEAYRAYDRAASQGLPKSPLEIASWQPPPQYFDRKFRDSFDIEKEIHPEDLLFPRSVRVLQVPDSFDLDEFAQTVEEHLDASDCLHHRILSPRSDARLHPYMMINNSPLLARAAFYQCSLGFTYYRKIDGYLLYLDSEGLHPDSLAAFIPAETASLRRLYKGADIRLGSISLSNTNLGAFSPRRRTVHARSIGDLGPDLSDHAQFATTVTGAFRVRDDGKTPTYVTRYVGFSRSRISDRGMVEFNEFNEWLDELVVALDDTTTKPPRVFDRYAEVIHRPPDVTPRNILLDFDPADFIDSQGPPSVSLHIDDLCSDVAAGKFRLVANDDPHEVAIAWDETTRRYILSCNDLDDRFSIAATSSGPRAMSLLSYLNREQAFRVIPVGGRGAAYCIYVSRRFYKPRLPLGPTTSSDNPDLLRLVEAVTELGVIPSEKGPDNSASEAGWAAGSLFAFIDSCGSASKLADDMRFDVLVCDDGGTEIADFIGLDLTNGRVVAIHAKAFKVAKPLSASALQEVSAQALKNLGFLQPYPYGTPPNLQRWSRPWRSRAGRVTSRVRRGSGTPNHLWNQFREALIDPQVTREVWIMMGQGPSQARLREESRKAQPKAEVIQMLFSLQATWGAVSSVGARLRVLSSP